MKHLYLLAALLASGSLFAQIPNAGFETWDAMGSYDMPEGWGNLNTTTEAASVYTCAKGTPGSPGTAYLELTSRTVAGMGVVPGIAVSGGLDQTTFQPSAGFAFNQRPASLIGKWQYMGSGADLGYIAVTLTRWNTVSASRETVASVVHHLSGMAMSWANFNISLTYASGETPDTAMIVLSASGNSPQNYSYLYVDNLSFSGSVTGIEEQGADATFDLFPNPSIDAINIRWSSASGPMQATLSDASGRIVHTEKVNPTNNTAHMDVSAMAEGSYLLSITDRQGKRFTRPVIITH
jgi:hypothetical protein